MRNTFIKYRLYNRGFKAGLFLIAVAISAAAFVKYSEPVSSQKLDNDGMPAVSVRSLRQEAKRGDGVPKVSAAVAYGESMPVRKMPVIAFDTTGLSPVPKDIEEIREKEREKRLIIDKKGEGADSPLTEAEKEELVEQKSSALGLAQAEENEINKQNKEIIRTINPNAPESEDGAVSPAGRFKKLSPVALPTPSVSFEGIAFSDTQAIGQGYLPPDTNGEVGPNHFVQSVNSAFRVWSKTGTPLTATISLGSLFSTIPGPCASKIDGDPIVIYDQLADRWLISQFCVSVANPNNHELIAVSKTGDPTGAYFLYDFMMPNNKFNDYPKFGMWPDGYYMSDNQFDQSGNTYLGAGYFAFDRAKMLAGDSSASYIYFDSCPTNVNCLIGGVLPSDLDGFTPPPAGSPNTFAYFTANEYDDPMDGLRFFDFHADFATPSNSTFTERTGSPMAVAAFNPNVAKVTAPPPSTTGASLATLSDRIMFRLAYRNFGGGNESLIVTHSVSVTDPTPTHAGVRYYQLNRTTPTDAYTIAEQQTFSPDATSRWMGSGAMNFQGDTAVGFSVSSTTIFPSVAYAARLSTDPPGSGLAQGEQTLIAGAGSQTHSTGRWGDYSEMSVDPEDDCTFWYTQEYYSTSGSAPWKTRISKFAPRACTTSPRGSIQGTVTSCATGLPVTGVSVNATGGFDRLTGAPGTYSMTTIPGTFTVFASKTGYTSATVTGVSVSNGGSSTASVCLAPVALLNAANPTITTGNNRLEPRECNQLNIPITNNGAALATVVSATLSTTTPGVVIKTATSNYPDVAANGGVQTNLTPFEVSTSGSLACFSSVDLKLTVTYTGGSGPMNTTFTLPVGKVAEPNYLIEASTGTITTTGTLVPTSADDDAIVTIPLPADFAASVYGIPITSLSADTNGSLRVNGAGVPAVTNQTLPAAGTTGQLPATTPVLFPFWDDLDMTATVTTDGGIYTETTGTAPNRTFKIEWRARHWVSGQQQGAADTNFAILIHENADNFEFVYPLAGSGSFQGGRSATIGVQAATTGSSYTQSSFNTAAVVNGRKLSFIRTPSVCVQGPGNCFGSTLYNLSGRIFTPDGQGLKSARVSLTGLGGTVSVLTNSFGFYTFSQVEPGLIYTMTVSSKRYRFQPQSLQPSSDLASINFVGVE